MSLAAPTLPGGAAAPGVAPGLALGTGRLALALQEAFTAGARLRAERTSVPDAGAFRAQLVQLLARAEQEAQQAGYAAADARLAVFATVAFLDETVLNARQPSLADWARRPLQEELFGGHMAGEWFFQHVDQLLARPDTPELGDLLEVHQLALLLGFRGRYGASDGGALHAIAARVGERIGRIRGPAGELVPGWRPPDDAPPAVDRWQRPLIAGLATAVVVAGVCWATAAWLLGGAAREIGAR